MIKDADSILLQLLVKVKGHLSDTMDEVNFSLRPKFGLRP